MRAATGSIDLPVEAAGGKIGGFGAVRVVLGLVLAAAAAMKAYELGTEPVLHTGFLWSRPLLIALVECELLFAAWLLSGLRPRLTWLLLLLCFSGFACVTLYQAITRQPSCGCFGKVDVNPWYTLAFDLFALAALVRWRPRAPKLPSHLAQRQLATIVAAIVVLLTAGAGYFMLQYSPVALAESGHIGEGNDLVVLEPESWVGRQFPLLEYIDITEELEDGRWIVILYSHDCSSCHETIRKYEQIVRSWGTRPHDERIALVEVPAYGPDVQLASDVRPVFARGRLTDVKEWFIQTPAIVVLDKGVVVRVGDERVGTDHGKGRDDGSSD